MKMHKLSKSTVRMAGLPLLFALMICVGLVVVSTGVTYARYRTEHRDGITVQVGHPETILLGTVEDGVFKSTTGLSWVVDADNNVASLQFAVANGESETSYSTRDQAISLSMIGSLGILKGGEPPALSVTFIPQGETGEEQTVAATVSAIEEGTALYHSFGPGWLYTFYETTAEGVRELTWELPGNRWSYIVLTMQTDGGISGVLQPLISAELISD